MLRMICQWEAWWQNEAELQEFKMKFQENDLTILQLYHLHIYFLSYMKRRIKAIGKYILRDPAVFHLRTEKLEYPSLSHRIYMIKENQHTLKLPFTGLHKGLEGFNYSELEMP